MSEIEKMYKNAGVDYEERYNNCTLNKEGECKLKCSCDICKYSEEKYIYPPFTAEKQIELIKFITSLGVCEIENWNDKGFHFAIKRERIYPTMFLSLSNINLQETLADVINNLWQDLTEEEKQQVKGILE